MTFSSTVHSTYQTIDPYEGAIHTFEAGDPANETVLFVHGYMAHGLMYSRVIDLLADDFHLVMLDLPGHGLDESFRNKSIKTTMSDNVIWLTRVIETLKPDHLVGHSFGATLAYEVARHHQTLKSVMLVDPGLHIPSGKIEDLIAKRLPIRAARLFASRPVFRMIEGLQWQGQRMTNVEVDRYIRPYRERERLRYMVRLGSDLLEAACIERTLDPLACKTKVLWGRKDRIIPLKYATIVANALKSDLQIIDASGHSPAEDTPKIFADSLRNFINL